MSNGIKVKLWHAPYNGGWVGFDRRQWKAFRFGYGLREYNHIGEEEMEPVLHWCFFGLRR